ncbi:MAG: signal recognition particle protein [Chloroflexi bacterium]|nr:signal recognition particle protein [Chloroflexota bacterium]
MAVFESLSDRLTAVFDKLRSRGTVTEADLDAALKEVRIALLEADVNFKIVRQFVASVREKALGTEVLKGLNPAQQVIKIVHDELVEMLGGGQARINTAPNPPNVVMLVGLQGSGKTTTAAKLALNLRKQGNRPLLVAGDPYRPAAVTQIQTLGKQLDIPVYHEQGRKPPDLAQDAIRYADRSGFNYVIIDTAGRTVIDEAMMREVAEIRRRVNPPEVLLVADAMTGQDAVKIAEQFNQQVGLTGVVLTKMDGDARGGAALSLRSVTGVPIKYVGVSEKPDGLEPFHPDRVATRILGMGDVMTLIEKAQLQTSEEEAKRLEKKFRTATFDLEDFLEQMQKIRQMGPLEQLLGMIPGVSQAMRGQNVQLDEKQIKRIEAIIQSMTREERQNPDIIGSSRKRRIARGSGMTTADVNRLLNQFREMQKMMKMVSRGKMPRGMRGLPFGMG